MQGQEIGNYILQSPLGKGGMGEVFLARHKSLGTYAAVKVLHQTSVEPQFEERFTREARTQAGLSHPNIARVLDHVQHQGRWYLITEYMPAGTLRDAMRKNPGPVPVPQALAWARQALRGLQHAHGQGIVHRDIKPGNILLTQQDEAAVTDFGLAKIVGGAKLTQTGTAIGTPAYMSPEQLNGSEEIDHRTDLYSMGVVLYELLTGRVPFPMETASEVVRILVNEPPPLDELNPDLPPDIGDMVLRALAKNPQDRYADCGQFAEAIEAFEKGEGAVSAANPVVAAVPPPPVPLSAVPASAVPASAVPASAVPPPPPPTPLEATLVEPTAVLSPAAQISPPPLQRQRSRTRWAVAAVAMALTGLAMAASAAYLFWPDAGSNQPATVVGEFGNQGLPSIDEPSGDDATTTSSATHEAQLPDTEELAMNAPSASAAQVDRSLEPELNDFPAGDIASELADDRTVKSVRFEEVAAVSAPALRPPAPRLPAPPSESMDLPTDPRVAVVALGDPLFGHAFEQEVEDRLTNFGIDVADEHASLVVSDALRRYGDDISTPELTILLRESGFHVLVLIQVEYLDSRQLHYLGRTSEAHRSRVHVNTYLSASEEDEEALGGWRETVEYTQLNAERKAESFLLKDNQNMANAILDGWRAFRR